MNGKILGDGVIRGYDGRRYAFSANEIQNAQGKNINDLVGSEVDFEISNSGLAISIYITEFQSIFQPINSYPQNHFSQSNTFQSAQTDSIPKQSLQIPQNITNAKCATTPNQIPEDAEYIKDVGIVFMVVIFIAIVVGSVVKIFWGDYSYNWVSYVLCAIAFFIYFSAYGALSAVAKTARSIDLEQNIMNYFFSQVGLAVLCLVFYHHLYKNSDTPKVVFQFIALCFIICIIYLLYLRYRIYEKIAYITNQPLFMVAFWLILSIVLSPIGIIVYIIAWFKIREVNYDMDECQYRQYIETQKAIEEAKKAEEAKQKARDIKIGLIFWTLFVCIFMAILFWIKYYRVVS